MFALMCVLTGAAVQLWNMPQSEIDSYLGGLTSRHPDFGRRLAEIAQASLDTPYVGDPLGEGLDGKYDKDPLMDLAHVDCVTFIEQAIALAASSSYKDALDQLQKIRYKDGKIAFEHRNHFMEADWIPNNRFCTDVTKTLKCPTESATRTISRKTFFEKKNAPELGKNIPDQPLTLAYVPVAQVSVAEPNLPSPALILLVGKIDWLFCLHCGLYIRDDSGKGIVYQASSKEKKVVTTPLSDFFKDNTRYVGFTAYAITDLCP